MRISICLSVCLSTYLPSYLSFYLSVIFVLGCTSIREWLIHNSTAEPGATKNVTCGNASSTEMMRSKPRPKSAPANQREKERPSGGCHSTGTYQHMLKNI